MIRVLVAGLGAGFGGVSRVIMNVLNNMPKDKVEFTVIETYDSAYHNEIIDGGNKIVEIPPFKKYFKYKKAIKKLFECEKFDFVWINNTAKVDLIIMKYAKKHGVKVIWHSHGSVQEGGKLKGFVFELLNKINEKKFYRYLDYGIACSNSSAEYFYNKKYAKDNVIVMPNSIDCKKYVFSEKKRAKSRTEFNVHEGDIVLACIGRVCEVKNLDFAVKVLADLPDNYKLVIIGSGETEKLKKSIDQNGVASRTVLLGERNDVADLLNGIDILLLPSKSEGLPMVVLEAQANGIKCLISDRVSKECKALDTAEFLSIDSHEEWKNAIIKANTERLGDALAIMKEKGFDVFGYVKKFGEILYELSADKKQ